MMEIYVLRAIIVWLEYVQSTLQQRAMILTPATSLAFAILCQELAIILPNPMELLAMTITLALRQTHVR